MGFGAGEGDVAGRSGGGGSGLGTAAGALVGGIGVDARGYVEGVVLGGLHR
jgi:hypothetical protein